MEQRIELSVWEQLGLDVAPFTVQAQASMALVHFYFSQLAPAGAAVLARLCWRAAGGEWWSSLFLKPSPSHR